MISLVPPVPSITAVRPPHEQAGAMLGDTVTVEGRHLDGANRAVRIESSRLGVAHDIPALTGNEPDVVRFEVPSLPADLPSGEYSLQVLVPRPGESRQRPSNALSLIVLPDITTSLPLSVARDAQGNATVTLSFQPEARPHQRVSLILAGRQIFAAPQTAPAGTLTFFAEDAPVGSHLVRLRVDHFDSLIVDRSVKPPEFLDRRIVIT
jgi:hypothetical protein